MKENIKYLTTAEAAEILRVHPMTIRRLIAQKRIKALRVGSRSFRIPVDELTNFERVNTQ
jgi:excisionase family DNA binding protein